MCVLQRQGDPVGGCLLWPILLKIAEVGKFFGASFSAEKIRINIYKKWIWLPWRGAVA
jgi:hypothetical protein